MDGLKTSRQIFRFAFPMLLLFASAAQAGERAIEKLPITITEAKQDFNGDGKPDTLTLKMISGKLLKNEGMWCGAGGEIYEGSFVIDVAVNGKVNRNNLEGYNEFSAAPWNIDFVDYNHDGRIDFSLGRYGSCNGWFYRLYTVSPHGGITELKLPDNIEIFTLDGIDLTDDGIGYKYYDNSVGNWYYDTLRWDSHKKQFVIEQLQGTPPPERE